MSTLKTTTLFCAAAALMSSVHSVQAADPSLPSLAGKWSGEFTSDVDGYEGTLGAELKQSADGQLTGILPYIEQNNIYKFRVAAGDINNDGKAEIITAVELEGDATLFMTIQGVYLPPVKAGAQPMLVGTYEILRVDADGNTQKVDWGTFGIIAILIG